MFFSKASYPKGIATRRKLAGFVLVCLTALVLWIFLPSYRFLDLLLNEEPHFSGQNSEIRQTVQTISELNIKVLSYQPSSPSRSTIIVVPGLHPMGVYDPRFQHFLRSCAMMGFQVIAPDIEEFREFRVSVRSVKLLERLILVLPQYYSEGSLSNLGIIGISYGAGPVFLVATRVAIKERIDFIGSIGGYFSLQDAIHYALTGLHEMNGKLRLDHPHEWGRLIFALNNINQLAPRADSEKIREILWLRLQLRQKEAEAAEQLLRDPGKIFVKQVLHGPRPVSMGRFQSVVAGYAPLFQELSPKSVIGQLSPHLRIYLLHGYRDNIIPFTQTLKLKTALTQMGYTSVHSNICFALVHADRVKDESAFWDKIKFMLWVRSFLSEAR